MDADWEGLIKDIHINLHIDMPEYHDYEFILDCLGGKGTLARIQALNSEVLFHTTDGRSISLHELTDSNPIKPGSGISSTDALGFQWSELSPPEDGGEAYSVRFPQDTALSFRTSDARATIREMQFKVRFSRATEPIAIYGEEYVSFVMHAIFENKKFAILSDGAIRKFGSP